MTKKQLALAIIERLKQEYPQSGCSLEYDPVYIVSRYISADSCRDIQIPPYLLKISFS